MNYASMTKNDLLAVAKEKNLVGRHDMTKDELIEALGQEDRLQALDEAEAELVEALANDEANGEAEAEVTEPSLTIEPVQDTKFHVDPAVTLDVKRKYPSERKRGPDGKIIRQGVNLSGNMPYRQKLYFIDPEVVGSDNWETAIKACPKQVRAIVETMVKYDVDSKENAKRGCEIVALAKEHGILETRIENGPLFAYYRRVMDTVGLRQA